jgi:O-antigen ligase
MFTKVCSRVPTVYPVQNVVSFLLAATLFMIPLSTTAKSICIVAALLTIIFAPAYRHDLTHIINKSWCKAAIALFLMAFLACFWGPASIHEKWTAVEKYSKLLYLPVLAVGFRDEHARKLGLYGFLLAMVVTCFFAILAFIGVIPLHDAEAGGMFRNHIMTGYMMAFAAYLSGFLFLQSRGKGRWVFAALTLLFSYHVLFINNGRTGYVVYVLLMILLMLQSFSWRQALCGSMLGMVLLAVNFHYSPVMQQAVLIAVSDCERYLKNEKNTSIGYRLQFHDYAYELFKRHPWIGNGSAGFMHIYHEENPIPSRGDRLLEPHSQYWLVASEFGVLGLGLLLVFFINLLIASWKLPNLKPIALAVLLPFIIANASDSLLFYSGTGYFFVLFMALCLGSSLK